MSRPLLIPLSLCTLFSFSACKGTPGHPDAAITDHDAATDAARPDASIPPGLGRIVADILVEPNSDVDLVFVVDNSGSMSEEQFALAAGFQNFLSQLEAANGAPANLHLGIVSTDPGIGIGGLGSCSPDGDGGRFENTPSSACTPHGPESFIIDTEGEQGGRTTNYAGSLADAFSCVAQLGTSGCGFEQPLEALRKSLDGSNIGNSGFLRDDALLAVIILSDEDDCSAFDTSIYDPDAPPASGLGPIDSFRCFEQGVVCEPDDPRTEGPKLGCKSRDDSDYLHIVDEYADFLRGLKSDPSMVVAASMVGSAGPVVVGSNDQGEARLLPSCSGAAGEATPALRLEQFINSFSIRGHVTSICDDMSTSLNEIAGHIADVMRASPCLAEDVEDFSACQVADRTDGVDSPMSACDNLGSPADSTALPCYVLGTDPACTQTQNQQAVVVYREQLPPPGTHLLVGCGDA